MSTPMMKQYHRIKEKNRDAILFYRMGDFFEMFEEDAVVASKVLGLTLTARNHGGSGNTPLCGFPHHALDRYTVKMIDSGYKVAICEQVEDPKTAKGVVKRDIVEVITRGTATNANLLKEKSNNFLVSIYENGKIVGFSGADVSTGEFFCAEVNREKLLTELEKLNPAEILFCESKQQDTIIKKIKEEFSNIVFTAVEEWRFSFNTAYRDLTAHFNTASLEGFGVEGLKTAVIAAGVLFAYIKDQKKNRVGHIKKISPVFTERYMALDGATIKNLELLNPLHPEDKASTLLWVLDRTKTAMGGRLLRRFIVNPLLDPGEIEGRQQGVDFFFKESMIREKIQSVFKEMCDVERLNGRIGYERVNARDLYMLKNSLIKLQSILALLDQIDLPVIKDNLKAFYGNEPIIEKLESAIADNPPLSVAEGGIFKRGYSQKLDEIVEGAKEGKAWIAGLQKKERERTGIPSLKVGYNKVFGYYIEVSKTNLDKVPEEYIRKQTLVNGERYITESLKQWEAIVLNAEEKQNRLELDLFIALRKWMCSFLEKLKEIADSLALLDCLSTLAEVAFRNGYVKPEVNTSDEIVIEDGRHPVIECLDFTEEFVPNGISIRNSGAFIHLITGPNMAGKSTYLRQIGLLVLMTQMGSFIPAGSAKIGLADRIFTRVGASDRLSKGQSTFLVEMQELANILNNATPKSLILLDEIGRGTSTFDGLSIAWSLVEYIHNKKDVSAKTLFATHYHELTEIPLVLKGVKNFNIAVKEWNDEIIFLRKIVEGACDHSYGIQVARLAGVPESIIGRAKEVLQNLEAGELTPDQKPVIARTPDKANRKSERKIKEEYQLSLFASANKGALDILKEVDVNQMTPLEALNKLFEIKKKLHT